MVLEGIEQEGGGKGETEREIIIDVTGTAVSPLPGTKGNKCCF